MTAPDALAFVPGESQPHVASSAGADLAAILRQAVEDERRKWEQGGGGGGDGGGGTDLLGLATMAAGPDPSLGPDLGGVGAFGGGAFAGGGGAFGMPARGPGPMFASLPPGGDSTMFDLGSVGGGDAAIPGAFGSFGLGPPTSGVLGGLFSTGGSWGPFSGSAGPFGAGGSFGNPNFSIGLGVGPTGSIGPSVRIGGDTLVGRSATTALGQTLAALAARFGIEMTTPNLLALIAPTVAHALGPVGLAVKGFDTFVDLASNIARAFGVTVGRDALQGMMAEDLDVEATVFGGGQVTSAAIAEGLAAVGQANANPGSYVSISPKAAYALMGQGYSGQLFSDGRGGYVTGARGYTGLNPVDLDPTPPAFPDFDLGTFFGSLFSGLFGRGGDEPADPDAPTAPTADPTSEPSGVPGAFGDVGQGGTSAPPSTPDAPADGGGGGGGGGGCYLATWALTALPPAEQAQARRFFADFYRLFVAQQPDGQRLFAVYQGAARRLLAELGRRPLAEQRAAQQAIYDELVRPTGEAIEAGEVDDAVRNMIAVVTRLADQLGVPLPERHARPVGDLFAQLGLGDPTAGLRGTGAEAGYLADWALARMGMSLDERRRRGWAEFGRVFAKRFPLTGASQFRRYARLARQVVAALDRQPEPAQRQAQRMIYQRIVAPVGENLELHEVDEAWTRMRTTALALAQRLGIEVDPADVPQPRHEMEARAQERRAKARRARTTQTEGSAAVPAAEQAP